MPIDQMWAERIEYGTGIGVVIRIGDRRNSVRIYEGMSAQEFYNAIVRLGQWAVNNDVEIV